jgi:hypothetical protein
MNILLASTDSQICSILFCLTFALCCWFMIRKTRLPLSLSLSLSLSLYRARSRSFALEWQHQLNHGVDAARPLLYLPAVVALVGSEVLANLINGG